MSIAWKSRDFSAYEDRPHPTAWGNLGTVLPFLTESDSDLISFTVKVI